MNEKVHEAHGPLEREHDPEKDTGVIEGLVEGDGTIENRGQFVGPPLVVTYGPLPPSPVDLWLDRRRIPKKWDGCSREKALEISVRIHIRYSDSPPFDFLDHHFTIEEFRAAGGTVIERGEGVKVVLENPEPNAAEIPVRTDPAKHHLSDFGAYADILSVHRNGISNKEATAEFQRNIRREVIPTSPGLAFAPIIKGPYTRLTMDMRSDGCGSTIPGARDDWAPEEREVAFEEQWGEEFER